MVSEHTVDGPLPGPGRHLIEASAGTGKTFTLAALVTRLVAEREVPIDRILVRRHLHPGRSGGAARPDPSPAR